MKKQIFHNSTPPMPTNFPIPDMNTVDNVTLDLISEVPFWLNGDRVIYHAELNAAWFGLTIGQAKQQEMPSEYAVVQSTDANAGIIIYGKYSDEWIYNPSCRFLVRILLEKIYINLNTK
jgi:hypothetical protein